MEINGKSILAGHSGINFTTGRIFKSAIIIINKRENHKETNPIVKRIKLYKIIKNTFISFSEIHSSAIFPFLSMDMRTPFRNVTQLKNAILKENEITETS